MKKALFALPVAALLLAGCSSPAPSVSNGGDAAKPAAEATTPAPPADRSAKFGDTVTYDDGVKITLKSLGFVKTSQYAVGAVEGQAAVFELTVVNGGKTELNASMMSFAKISYGANNKKATSVGDAEQQIGSETLSTILPGETQTVKVGAGVPKASASAVRVEISGPNSFTDKPAIFKGAVK